MRNIITANVIGLNEQGCLDILIEETGERGIIPAGEISIRPNRNPVYLIGKTIHAAVISEGGETVCSARQYEAEELASVRRSFENGTQNTYWAELICLDSTEKMALYSIGQGIVGAVYVSDFCLTRLPDYRCMRLPEKMPVTIRSIEEDGRINLTTAASFGSFEENVERLNLTEGCCAEGVVAVTMPAIGSSIVFLAPNLSVLAPYAAPGSRVRMTVQYIDREHRVVRAKMNCVVESHARLDCGASVVGAIEPVVDQEAFEEQNRRIPCDRPEALPEKTVVPDFGITASESPFRLFPAESLSFDQGPTRGSAAFSAAMQNGLLNDEHRMIACAVDLLRYATSKHLQQFLYLTEGKGIAPKKLDKLLARLCEYGVLSRFCYVSGEEGQRKSSVLHVYMRGPRYRIMAEYKSYFKVIPGQGDPSVKSKTRIAVNQLFLGCMYRGGVRAWDANGFIEPAEWDHRHLNYRYRLMMEDGTECFLESCRAGDWDDLAHRLEHYRSRFTEEMAANSRILITFENEEAAREAAGIIRDMELPFRVGITHDILCYTDNPFTEIREAVPAVVTRSIFTAFFDNLKKRFTA